MHNTLRTWCVIFAALACAACELEPDVWSLEVDAGHPALIACALEAWCAASDGAQCGSIGEGGSSILDVDAPAMGEWLGLHTGRPDGSSRVAIDRTLDDDAYYTTVVHELGHHYGCGHLDAGVMVGTVNRIWAACDVTIVTAVELECAQ